MFSILGRTMYKRRKAVVGAWLLFLTLSTTLGPRLFDRLSTDLEIPASESDLTAQRIDQLTGGSAGLPGDVFAVIDGLPVDDPATANLVTTALDEVRAHPGVTRVADYYSTSAPSLVSMDGRATLVAVDTATAAGTDHAAATLRGIDAPRVLVGGGEILDEEFVESTEADLQKGEIISLPIVLVLLLIVFGGVVAAGTPLIVALVTVPGAMLILYTVSLFNDIAFFAISVVTMLGLGLSVDYALLMVSRFREERVNGQDLAVSIEQMVATAGRTVVFSGLTVIVSLTAFLLYPADPLQTFTWAGGGVVAMAVLAALTLLPALLGIWGHNIKPAAVRVEGSGFFYRVSRLVQRRPVAILLTVGVGLAALWIPFTDARLEDSDWRTLPASSESRRVFETLDTRFGGDNTDPIVVLVEADRSEPTLARIGSDISAIDGVVEIQERPVAASGFTIFDVVAEGASRGEVAERVVNEIRSMSAPFDISVAGTTAEQLDFRAFLFDRLPWVLLYIAVVTFALLFLMTGSVFVPAKAILMNVLSLGGTFGVLVWGFQNGALENLMGFQSVGALDTVVPLVIFVFAFGLSMDYEVFLLSRIKEIHDQTGDNDRAVAEGLQRTGRIVTSAAALIVVVFAGFALGETLIIKQFGVGMALAVVIDVSIVRTLIVPSTMKLMGEWNWWAPKPLRRIYDRFGISETPRTAEEYAPAA